MIVYEFTYIDDLDLSIQEVVKSAEDIVMGECRFQDWGPWYELKLRKKEENRYYFEVEE